MSYAARSKYDEADRARRYAHRNATRDQQEWRLLRRVLEQLPAQPRSALDIPCGAGRMTRRLVELGIPTRAADLSPAMCAITHEALAGRPGFGGVTQADLEGPQPASLAPADLVLCFRFFHHLPDAAHRSRVLASLRALTGRWLLLSFHHPVSPHNLRRRLRRVLRGRRSDRHTLWPGWLRREAAGAGLTLTSLWPLARYRRELWLAVLEPAQ